MRRLLCSLGALILAPACAAEPHTPNIVIIIADDISADFGAYSDEVQTPNINALASRGVTFFNAYTAASSCSPSRNSLITGRFPHNHGAPELHMPLPEGQNVFPALLQEAGYYTAAAGKWHMGDYPRSAFDRIEDPSYAEDFTGARDWLTLLRERPKEKPFFLWLAAFDAHRPWEPDELEEPHDPAKVRVPAGLADTPATRSDLAAYYDEVRRFDRHVGGVVEELAAQGVLSNTLLIITSDNGRPFPRSKTTIFEGGMRIPLVVHWPDGQLAEGTVSEELVSLIDVAPTILDASAIDIPASVQGLSLLGHVQDTTQDVRQVLFGERNWHTQRGISRMVREGDFVYFREFTPQAYRFLMVGHQNPAYAELLRLRALDQLGPIELQTFSEELPPEELYNVADDPEQLVNLAGDPQYGKVLARMRSLLAEWQERTGDSIPAFDEQTPDRHDRQTYEHLFEGAARPSGGKVAGEDAGAETITDRGPF